MLVLDDEAASSALGEELNESAPPTQEGGEGIVCGIADAADAAESKLLYYLLQPILRSYVTYTYMPRPAPALVPW